MANRVTTLEYLATGGRLSKITDMAGRVSTYGYDGAGNLTTIKHAVGTPDEVTTTLDYDDDELVTVTDPRGHTSRIRYTALNRWESSVEDWVSQSRATLSHSTSRPHSGAGSLKADLSGVTVDDWATVEKDLNASPRALNSTSQELVVWVYLPSGSSALDARTTLKYMDHDPSTATWRRLTAGAWNALREPYYELEWTDQVREIELQFKTPSGTFTGSVWIDDLFVKGEVASQTDAKPAQSTIVKYSYDADTRTAVVSRPDQNGTYRDMTFVYDRSGQVTDVTDPKNNKTSAGYDEFMHLKSVTPAGGTGSYTLGYYPNSNELQTAANPLGETSRRGANTTTGDTRYVRDPFNEHAWSTNQAFDATTFTRDTAGNVTQTATGRYAAGTNLETDPLPAASSTHRKALFSYYAGTGLLASMTDPKNNVTNLDYDRPKGYLTKIDAPPGAGEASRRETTITRNADGSAASVVDPKGLKTTYEYDNLGRLRKINYGVTLVGAAFSVSYTLDANGNLTAMSDKAGSTTWTYDENNRRTSESRTQNGVTRTARYVYYPNGQLQKISTLGNPTGRKALLVVGDKTALTAGDTALRNRLRDVLGLTVTLASDSDAENTAGQDLVVVAESVTSSTIGAKYKSAAVPLVHLEESAWDDVALSNAGSLGTATKLDVLDANHQIANGNSGAGVTIASASNSLGYATTFGTGVKKVLAPTGSTTNVTGFAYESGGSMVGGFAAPARRVALGYRDGAVGDLTHTGWGLFDASVESALQVETSLLAYDDALRLSTQTDPKDGRRKVTFDYDAQSRYKSITYGSGVSQLTTYDKAGRVDLLQLKNAAGSELQRFDYDYAIDAAGTEAPDYKGGHLRRVTELDGSRVEYDYQLAFDRLWRAYRSGTYAVNYEYDYDLNNNRTSVKVNGGTATLSSYDGANQMNNSGGTAHGYDRNGNLTSFGANTLSYDESNEWVSGTVNGNVLAFSYDGQGRRASRTVGTGRTDYWYDETGLALENGATNATYLRAPDGLALSISGPAGFGNYGRDRQGSTTALTRDDGTQVNNYRYDPWGNWLTATGMYNPITYHGGYVDTASGMLLMGARYYQPSTGRFTQLDPHPGKLLDINRYAYAGCNPVNYSDPSGLSHCNLVTMFAAAGGFLVGQAGAIAGTLALANIFSSAAAAGTAVTLGAIAAPAFVVYAGVLGVVFSTAILLWCATS